MGNYKDVTIISHCGGINGFTCLGVRIPEAHVYAILLTNAGGAKNPGVALPIALRVAGRPVTTPTPMALAASKLQEYTGVFEVPGAPIAGVTEEFTIRNDTLVGQIGPYRTLKLLPVGKDRFYTNSNYLQFFRDEKGTITSLEYTSVYGNSMVRRQRKIDKPVARK